MRKGKGKKKKKEMQIQKKNFIEGCLNNSFEKISSEKVFEQILGFAEYCFNKSHSTSYAFTTYQTAWLKSHWPVEFFSSLLSANLADIAKIEKYVFQAEFYGINILKPCINSSEVSFFPIENVQNHSHISFGLGSIKNVGEMGAIVILSQRKLKGAFVSMTDVVKRLMYDELLGNSLIEALIYSGSLDKFGLSDSRKIMFSDSKKINKWIYKKQKIILKSQPLLIDMKWMTERENTLFGLRRDFKKKDILHDENQVGFQSKFTGLSDFNFKILEQIDIKLLLGTFQFMNFHDQYFQRKSETNKNLVEYTEESLINQNFLKTEKFLFIGLILEVQIYQVNFSTILIKFILEDTNGIFIGLDFMNFELLDTDFFLKTKNKIIRNLQSKKCLPGEMIMGFGVIKEDDYRNKLSLLNYYNLKKSLILVLRIRPDQIGNKALQILIIKCIRDNGKLDERIPTVPVIINIRGYFRTENIRLKSPINRSNVFIICEKLKIIGLESMVFKV